MEIVRQVRVNGHRVQLCKDNAGEFRTRIIAAGNNETILPTEGYERAGKAVGNLEQLRDILVATDLSKLLKTD